MMNDAETLGILKQLERGEISAEQAEERFNAPPGIEHDYQPRAEGAPDWMRRLWVYPLVAGILVVLFGAWIIAATVHANILWLICGLPLVLVGSLVLALAAAAVSTGHWLYVDIQGRGAHRRDFRFGLPFPLGLVRSALWLGTHLGPPHMRFRVRGRRVDFATTWAEADAFLNELEHELTQGHGLTVNVDDRNERVQVYLV